MKRRMRRKIKNLSIAVFVVLLSAITVKSAFATFNTNDKQSEKAAYSLSPAKIYSLDKSENDKLTVGYFSKPKAHAPEPSSLALFGSGLFGIVVSFVRRAYIMAKRMFDIAISVIAVILLSPLFLITAILIKLTSRGPVIFTQVRVGKEGEHFEIYKFRTMRVDAEKVSGPVWASKDDPRLTPIGKAL